MIEYNTKVFAVLNNYEGLQEYQVKGILYNKDGLQYFLNREWVCADMVGETEKELRMKLLSKCEEQYKKDVLKIESYFNKN